MIQSVYNYLIPEFMAKPVSVSNATHKRSELKSLYNRIVNLNKRSPLYKVTLSDDSQLFAISLKESSMALNDVLSKLSSKGEDSPLHAIKVTSDNPDSVAANIISEDADNLPEPFSIELKSLAKPQVNKSRLIPKEGARPKAGSYSFVANVEEKRYEFQFNIKPGVTNKEILGKLSRFMNRSNIGVTASVEEADKDYLVFSITSNATGTLGEPLFTLEDSGSPEKHVGLVEFYDLDHIDSYSSNARFLLNGSENESISNRLTLNHCLQLDFLHLSKEAVSVSYVPDAEKIFSNIQQFADSYNEMIHLAKDYPSSQGLSDRLIREMKGCLLPYKNEMESCGLYFDKDNTIQIDASLARQAIEEGDMQELFSAQHGLTRNLARKSSSITVNPMDYVDKKLITYPNYSKQGIAYTYSPTMYSGMLFNYYC